MTAHRVLVLLVFISGCASARHDARSANMPANASSNALLASTPVSAHETGPVTHVPDAAGLDAKPLRHFYLLSPGPHATLVVTRSDLPAH